jgi:ribosomal-protein-alanine N-acetyltransferase
VADDAPGELRMRTLVADGLTLEPQTAAHAKEMFAVLCDPALYAYEGEPPPSLEWLRTRFARLEARHSPDGSERWLNWIVRLPPAEAVGYVQATERRDGHAYVAYAISSAHWGRGVARRAVEAMIAELSERYGIEMLWAIFKEPNVRSRQLLVRLGFAVAPQESHAGHPVEPGEALMFRRVDGPGAGHPGAGTQ